MEAIFTATQARRNAKAIAQVIADFGSDYAAMADDERASTIHKLASIMAGKYAWQVRRDAFHAEIVATLTAHFQAAHTDHPAPVVMASRAPVATSDLHDAEINADLATSVTYTAAPEGMAAVIVSQHVDISEDADALTKLENMLADAEDRNARLEDTISQLRRELAEANDALEEAQQERKQHEEYKAEAETWRKAWEYMEEVQHHADTACGVVSKLERADLSLTCDGWQDQYTRKDIEDAMRAALSLSQEASSMYQDYLQA